MIVCMSNESDLYCYSEIKVLFEKPSHFNCIAELFLHTAKQCKCFDDLGEEEGLCLCVCGPRKLARVVSFRAISCSAKKRIRILKALTVWSLSLLIP